MRAIRHHLGLELLVFRQHHVKRARTGQLDLPPDVLRGSSGPARYHVRCRPDGCECQHHRRQLHVGHRSARSVFSTYLFTGGGKRQHGVLRRAAQYFVVTADAAAARASVDNRTNVQRIFVSVPSRTQAD